ncbi:hypothetical protein CEXT_709041 [Caerostris extrusa]|uniref:Uncharacterized protein n=1 Tax=Caerostris extrusa TaxID=172846 RepID=A0AAV4Y4M7_CAEEX|nr:hypothetical protein CEXT_709041 [Caerostris extrusa]
MINSAKEKAALSANGRAIPRMRTRTEASGETTFTLTQTSEIRERRNPSHLLPAFQFLVWQKQIAMMAFVIAIVLLSESNNFNHRNCIPEMRGC